MMNLTFSIWLSLLLLTNFGNK